MREESIEKIKNIALAICLTLGLIAIIGVFISIGNTEKLQNWSSIALIITYVYVIGAAALIIGFSFYQLIKHYQENKGFLIGIAALLVIWGISYLLSSDQLNATPKLMDTLLADYGEQAGGMIRNVDSFLYLTYFLIAIAVLAASYGTIKGLLNKNN